LGSADGIYSSISVVNTATAPLQGATVTIERQINNIWTIIGQGTTGSDGLVTFWVNPNYNHRITSIKTGYVTVVVTIQPTQSLYTLSMAQTTGEATYTSDIEGISWIYNPSIGIIRNKTWNFDVTVLSSTLNLENCKFELINATNVSQIFASATEAANTSYCLINHELTVLPGMVIFGKLYVDTTDSTGFVIVDADGKWSIFDRQVNGWRTFTNMFADFKDLDEFGDDPGKQVFSRFIFFFLMTTILFSVFFFFVSPELDSMAPNLFIITAVVIIASVGGLLTVNLGSDNISTFFEKYILCITLILFTAAQWVKQYKRGYTG